MSCAGRHFRSRTCGYALIEVTFALMLIAMLAAVALPGLVRGTGPASLRMAAFELSAILRQERIAAMRSGSIVTTTFGTDGVRPGAARAHLALPAGTVLTAPPSIRFLPDGHTSGGDIAIASPRGARVFLSVSPDSGAIRVRTP